MATKIIVVEQSQVQTARFLFQEFGVYIDHLDTNRFWSDNSVIQKNTKSLLKSNKIKFTLEYE